jgi:hypothetical protein
MYSKFISRLVVDDTLADILTYGGILLMIVIALL